MSDLIEHAPGVHLGQRHEDYLQDHGLGYGGVKDNYLNPIEWWDGSPHNPLREQAGDDEDRKLAFLRGAALHTFALDGEKVYDKVYAVRPTKARHPEALDTVDELMDACRKAGLDTRGRKADLVQRLVTARKRGAPTLIGVDILADLQRVFDFSGKKNIAPKDDRRIRLLHRMMMRTAAEWKLGEDSITLRDALHGGLSEVSVYWIDENGIRQRARFDKLKPNLSIDLKSITRWKKSNFKEELLKEVILRGYMIQAAHYQVARQELRKAVAEGRIYGGTKTQRRLLERIAKSDYWGWFFVFAKMDGAAQVKGILIRPETDAQFDRAKKQREEALAKFLYHREFHGGLDVPWFDPEVVFEPTETDWPLFSVLGQ